MQPKHIRAFEIEHTRFHLTDRGDGHLQVSSIHPYDDAHYHWAFQHTDGSWKVYRAGRYQISLGSLYQRLTPEQVAEKLLALDRAAHIQPRRAIW